MPKLELKCECITQNNTKQGGNATFIIAEETQSAATPGQPRQIAAKTVITLNCKNKDAAQFKPGESYMITIE